MSIVRVNKNADYFATSNKPFNDERLRWDTRGMIGYLLSKPDNWTIRLTDLIKQGPGGRDKVRAMLRDAQVHGYLNRYRVSKKDGTFFWLWDLFETPEMNQTPQTSGGFSVTGFHPVTGYPEVDKPVTGLPVDIVSTEEEEEEEEAAAEKNIYSVYQAEIGLLTPYISDALKDWEQDLPEQWIKDAILEASANGARSWKYINAILKRWHEQGNQEPNKKPQRRQAKSNGKKPAPFTPYQSTPEELERQRKEFTK